MTRAVCFVAALILLTAGDGAHAEEPGYHQRTFKTADGAEMAYAISVPKGDQSVPRPLVLALHPGGERPPYYGSWFARLVVVPALADVPAVLVAPDCPTKTWAEPGADRAVMALLEKVMAEQTIDRRRILVTGFSMGGRGTWFFSAQHPAFFTAAIPMAASTGEMSAEMLAKMPTYIVHSRRDERVPFGPAELNAQALEKLGRVVQFDAVEDLGHFQMGGYVPALKRAVRWVTERWGADRSTSR